MKHFLSILVILSFSSNCQQKQSSQIEVKDQLIEISRRCYERGLYWGTGGDISVRIPGTDRILVKGTGYCVGDLDASKISTVDLAGAHLGGPTPSHETPIHTGIYQQQGDVGAILHMHAPYSTAWATVGEQIPAITQHTASNKKV